MSVIDGLTLNVPSNPIIPFLEGDGIGVDISAVIIDARHRGWNEAAGLITRGANDAIQGNTVTYDFERQRTDATLLSCSEFEQAIIAKM